MRAHTHLNHKDWSTNVLRDSSSHLFHCEGEALRADESERERNTRTNETFKSHSSMDEASGTRTVHHFHWFDDCSPWINGYIFQMIHWTSQVECVCASTWSSYLILLVSFTDPDDKVRSERKKKIALFNLITIKVMACMYETKLLATFSHQHSILCNAHRSLVLSFLFFFATYTYLDLGHLFCFIHLFFFFILSLFFTFHVSPSSEYGNVSLPVLSSLLFLFVCLFCVCVF